MATEVKSEEETEMVDPSESGQAETPRKTRQRSPSYPFLSLPTAVERARVLYDRDKKAAIPRDSAIRHWGFSPKSSYAQQTVASLKTYGLVEFVGGSAMKLTLRALVILIGSEDSPQRARAIQEAALAPHLFAAMWKTYRSELPSDRTMITSLVLNHEFPSEAAAKDFIGKYKETMTYARLADSDSISPTDSPPQRDEAPEEGEMLETETASPVQSPTVSAPRPATKAGPPASDGESSLLLQVPFRGSTMTVRIAAGQKLTKAHLARVRSYLELAEDDLDLEG